MISKNQDQGKGAYQFVLDLSQTFFNVLEGVPALLGHVCSHKTIDFRCVNEFIWDCRNRKFHFEVVTDLLVQGFANSAVELYGNVV